MGYAGSDWIKGSMKKEMSPLGEAAANLLGDVFLGIYHMDTSLLKKVDWTDKYYIIVPIWSSALSTVDNNELTRLVVLAHDRMMRVDVMPHAFRYMKLGISQRTVREGDLSERCPTMERHIQIIRGHYTGTGGDVYGLRSNQ